MILDGHYTHASDVWAFGILAWELYQSFSTGQDGRPLSVPFYDLDNHEVNPKALITGIPAAFYRKFYQLPITDQLICSS